MARHRVSDERWQDQEAQPAESVRGRSWVSRLGRVSLSALVWLLLVVGGAWWALAAVGPWR